MMLHKFVFGTCFASRCKCIAATNCVAALWIPGSLSQGQAVCCLVKANPDREDK
jgi:hypothetical protein